VDPQSDFVQWALSSDLNIEEAFCAELLTEHGLLAWKIEHKVEDPDLYNWELRNERYRLRRLNPAHRASLAEVEVMRAAEMLPDLTNLDHWTNREDRTLRDFSGLRYCPRLKKIMVAPTDLPDLECLRFLPELDDLWLQDDGVADYSPLAYCAKLTQVHLWLRPSWCDLRGLARLPLLEHLTLHGNLPTLEGVGPLVKVTKVHFNGFGDGRAYLRDATALPEMPLLGEAHIVPWEHLDGIDKFAGLEELTIDGSFTDLSPLSRLPNLRKLVLGGERFTDLSPLARAPKLAVLRPCREMPVDYTPLLESQSLRELLPRYGRDASQEMIGLNAALGGWDSEFLLPHPRELSPPVFRIVDTGPSPDRRFADCVGKRVFDLAAPLHESEARWAGARLKSAIDTALRDKSWGEIDRFGHRAHECLLSVAVHSVDAADRLPEIIEACRAELAWFRNRWIVRLTVDPEAEWEQDPEAWNESERDEFTEHIAEAHDYVERRRQYLAFLERLRDFRIRQELGEEAPPEKFAPPPEPEEKEESDVLDRGDDWERRRHPEWNRYFLLIHICEEGVWGFPGYKGKNERLTGQVFEVSERCRASYEAEEED
jgi:hypothetical protein